LFNADGTEVVDAAEEGVIATQAQETPKKP
jgi:hypothetical protein